MKEFDIYLPSNDASGREIEPGKIEEIKRELLKHFGGYTDLKHRCEGAWKFGGVLFRDELNIVRVLDDGSADFDMESFKRRLEKSLGQESVLIVRREVGVV